MNLPDVVFSKWTRWTARADLDRIDLPGVYILAHFATPPPGNADPQAREVIYIGETCARTLKVRWDNFHKAAFDGGNNHSGGKKYRKDFGDNGGDLFVAAFPVDKLNDELCDELNNKLRPLFIRYVERKLIWEYAEKYLAAPKYNTK